MTRHPPNGFSSSGIVQWTLPIRLVDKAAERVVLVSPLHSPSGALAAGLARARLVHGLGMSRACLGHVLCKGGLEAMTTNRIGMDYYPENSRFVPLCTVEDIGTKDARAPAQRVFILRNSPMDKDDSVEFHQDPALLG